MWSYFRIATLSDGNVSPNCYHKLRTSCMQKICYKKIEHYFQNYSRSNHLNPQQLLLFAKHFDNVLYISMDYLLHQKVAVAQKLVSLCCSLFVPFCQLVQSDTQNWSSLSSCLYCCQGPRNVNFFLYKILSHSYFTIHTDVLLFSLSFLHFDNPFYTAKCS